MSNPTGNKLEKLVFGMFDQMIEGADKYVTKQGSTWLIFTEDKRWVIEFTNDKTLWFNYNVFQSELDLIGKDCTEERDLIKSWFESRFLNKPKVEEAHHVDVMKFFDKKMENTIENGVKETHSDVDTLDRIIEYTIHNGVKDAVEDTIQEGVKDTKYIVLNLLESVEDTIENGVKDTIEDCGPMVVAVEDTIQNGVRHTVSTCKEYLQVVEDTIQNGICDVKHSYDFEEIVVKDIIEDSYPHKHRVEGVIKNTVKDGI